jgi:hypothetical protein
MNGAADAGIIIRSKEKAMDMMQFIQTIVAIVGMVSIATVSLRYVSDRPKREEVNQMIDRALDAVNAKIDHVQADVAYIRTWIDDNKKRK